MITTINSAMSTEFCSKYIMSEFAKQKVAVGMS